MVNNTAIAIVILNIGNLLVYSMFSGSRTKRAKYRVLKWLRHVVMTAKFSVPNKQIWCP